MKTAAYGLLGLPLAMAALPVYVQAPAYYADRLGLPLGLTGAVLFGARLVDTVQDPWLGRVIDRLVRRDRLAPWLTGSAVVLAAAFAALWLPPVRQSAALAGWLALMLVLVCTAHSALNIAYLGWGARLDPDRRVLTRAAAWREAAGLLGVLLASVLPVWLLQGAAAPGMAAFSVLFALLLAAGLAVLLLAAPPWLAARDAIQAGWRQALAQPRFRRLLWPLLANAISVAIPATLALFFIRDRLAAAGAAGWLLGAYFLAGALGLPLWTRLAGCIGTVRAWRSGMLLAVVAFVRAGTLGPGDVLAYLLVCVLAGLALGADLALPPVLLAERIPPGEQPAGYYGIYTLLGKLALALSALALPLLAWLDYRPGQPAGDALALTYALLPCVFKLLAWHSLGRMIREEA
ncbi:MFS transporter [Jeongeupia chitinilytica]|uniref:Sugar:cation symporter n=1 Tax=Jeongeupia chitinilytica TaxID=1041641 RepID=A0ABQ3H0I6_9NEIS|nr:MFS transporter [Jeongeupia chitinilytica]GHD64273.1 sugar:cation symporter [Jeongeupia chitinilytica]